MRGTHDRRVTSPLRTAVHPRVCGERVSWTISAPASDGSSPRMRGTHRRPLLPPRPSFAGSSPRMRGTLLFRELKVGRNRPTPVHPRVCGERVAALITGKRHSGSSPRMRGTRGTLVGLVGLFRFIPAYAGNARRPGMCSPSRSVHPRVCGERNDLRVIAMMTVGSSPRMRGTPSRRLFRARGRGGSSPRMRGTPLRPPRSRRPNSTVHPRVCGERDYVHRRTDPRRRFIPAYAGNASRSRVGGPGFPIGSSPRMRGTRVWMVNPTRKCRFIPAYAGNAEAALEGLEHLRVHPRVCGERATPGFSGPHLDGSSPRMRGTQRFQIADVMPRRFIPAYAGNARPRSAPSRT